MNSTYGITVNYTIDIKNPNSHYAKVSLEIKDHGGKITSVKMPVWAPGSYMIREFERNIDQVKATSDGKPLVITKTDKSTWAFKPGSKTAVIQIEYDIYCFENSVRTSLISNDHAFLIFSSVLMYADPQNQKGNVSFVFPEAWKKISCTLPKISNHTFSYSNLDELIDSPVEIGNHDIIEFEVAGVKHSVAMVGKNNCDYNTFKSDLSKVCSTMYNIIGAHPCKSYLFIVHHVEEGGGGLEHANSCVVQIPRFNYSSSDKYKSFLGLCAHEYFHLWNVKRIRPAALGPFDYSKENHTNLLWVAEGITSYYDELAMYRAGYMTQEEYLKTLTGSLNMTLNRKGAYVQSMHDASFDAWIKEYRPNENSSNNSISYYLKGSVLAALLDIEIVTATDGKKSLDDLMKHLYNEFYIKQNRGFTDDEFYNAIDVVAGKPIGFRTWAETPNNAETLQKITSIFKKINCQVTDVAKPNPLHTGITTEMKGDRMFVKSVEANSPAWLSDVQVGDELIAVNDIRIKGALEDIIKLAGTEFNLLISRAGLIRTVTFKTAMSQRVDLNIKIENKDNPLFMKWLAK